MFHEENTYRRSGEHGFFRRTRYALLSTVITHKTTTGHRTLYKGELAGAVGSGLISRLWQPASTRTIALGFSSAGTSLAADAGIRVLREFWPDIWHRHAHSALPRRAVTAAALSLEFLPKPDPEAAPETEPVAEEAVTQNRLRVASEETGRRSPVPYVLFAAIAFADSCGPLVLPPLVVKRETRPRDKSVEKNSIDC